MSQAVRTPLVIVCGIAREAVRAVVHQREFRGRGTAVIHHDLSAVGEGIVRRRLCVHGCSQESVLELAHCCVSCTVREDLLPLLVELAARPSVERIVLHLDPSLEPEAICWELQHVVVGEAVAAEWVAVEGVLTVVSHAEWLDQATGDQPLAEVGPRHGIGIVGDDERTLAQLVVGQAEFADAIVLAGAAPDAWRAARTSAVLDRLAPLAPRVPLAELNVEHLLAAIPTSARRGVVDGAHDPLLRGQPPFDADAGVSLVLFEDRRPFHPERLHEAIDVLLDGVVRTKGRLWLASQPDTALWLESAGGGLRVGHAGPWLAALDDEAWMEQDPQRRAMAAVRWDAEFGDRAQEIVVLAHRASPEDIEAALRGALLTDAELVAGWDSWRQLTDPFGGWHTDPCVDTDTAGDSYVDSRNAEYGGPNRIEE
ncbi:G3E family GTPase [Tamaricihabitans halophyticus]|uniref:G3E family GTPase n=1 Tax=Tamaricihabitans halophyticus TaxID=1262583 RepID=A0A4R2R0R4_9PSEU|nr:GTP-binding protein [Tamaricihabitans halophyticus]TCP55314.1 G3E family GTPase [Tamaricihabitans halophyticus]